MNLNLLPSQAKFQMVKMKIRAKVRKFILFFTIGWVLVMVGVFVWWGISQIRLDMVNKTYTSWQKKYNGLGDYAVTSLQLKYRAKLVGQLLASRFEYGTSMNLVRGLFSENISLDNFELGNSKQVNVIGQTVGASGMNEVERKIDEINNGQVEGFTKARLADLNFTRNIWKFTMEVSLK